MEPIRMQQGNRRSRAPQTDEDGLNDVEDYGEDEDSFWSTRMPSSARRYRSVADVRAESGRSSADVQPGPSPRSSYAGSRAERHTIPPRRTATQAHVPVGRGIPSHPLRTSDDEEIDRRGSFRDYGQRRRFHWLFFVGVAMFVMIIGWLLFSMLANWWQTTQDDWHYGRPRTFQTNAAVGHNNDSAADPSHFIAMNLNRHIVIIEIPGGDVSKSVVFNGPTLLGPGQDLTPVTLTFQDVNGDGKPDMIINLQDSHIVFLNKSGSFAPAPPGLGS